MTTFGEMVRNGRKATGDTQRLLAERLGVNFTYLSKIENGRLEFPPSDDLIGNLAWALHLNRDDLFFAAGKVPPELVEKLKSDREFLRMVRELDVERIA